MSLTLSLRTMEISRIFLLNEKQYFSLMSQVFSFCGEMSSLSRVTFIDTWLANIHVRLHQTHGTVTVSRLQTRP